MTPSLSCPLRPRRQSFSSSWTSSSTTPPYSRVITQASLAETLRRMLRRLFDLPFSRLAANVHTMTFLADALYQLHMSVCAKQSSVIGSNLYADALACSMDTFTLFKPPCRSTVLFQSQSSDCLSKRIKQCRLRPAIQVLLVSLAKHVCAKKARQMPGSNLMENAEGFTVMQGLRTRHCTTGRGLEALASTSHQVRDPLMCTWLSMLSRHRLAERIAPAMMRYSSPLSAYTSANHALLGTLLVENMYVLLSDSLEAFHDPGTINAACKGSGNPTSLQAEGGPKEHSHGHGIGMGQFEGLRNLPYMAEGWQPSHPHQLSHPVPHHPQPLHHPQAHNLLQERGWPSAFAPTQRYTPLTIRQEKVVSMSRFEGAMDRLLQSL